MDDWPVVTYFIVKWIAISSRAEQRNRQTEPKPFFWNRWFESMWIRQHFGFEPNQTALKWFGLGLSFCKPFQTTKPLKKKNQFLFKCYSTQVKPNTSQPNTFIFFGKIENWALHLSSPKRKNE